jgi:hypothetical protein
MAMTPPREKAQGRRSEEKFMWQDIVRLIVAWGSMCAVIGFWYWVMRNIGTF